MPNKIAFNLVLAGLMVSLSGAVVAQGDEWYVGIGGGISWLRPDTAVSKIDVNEKHGQITTVFIGRDIDSRKSGQIQLYSFGDAEFSDDQGTAYYSGGDASLLFRFYDSRNYQPRGTQFGTSLYGRFAVGYMQRDSDLLLDKDTPAYFGAGAGMETHLSNRLAMRLEALFHDTDAGSATLTLVSRFGGRRPLPAARTPDPFNPPTPSHPIATDTTEPRTTQNPADAAATHITVQESAVAVPTDLPETYEILTKVEIIDSPDERQAAHEGVTAPQIDSDADGVMNEQDQCPESTPGYPVNVRGCPAFGDTLSDLSFDDRTADLSSRIHTDLDVLIQQLNEFPTTYIELVAHTDNTGSEAEQSDLTRQRLRNIGVYLVRNGINHERLLLRSYGGTRPAFDNSTTSGRRRNNRIEVFENP